jgi:hypothetical protein
MTVLSQPPPKRGGPKNRPQLNRMARSIFSPTNLSGILPVGGPSLAAYLKAGTEARHTGFIRGLEILRSRRVLRITAKGTSVEIYIGLPFKREVPGV